MQHETKAFYLFSTLMSLIMSGGMSLVLGFITFDPKEAIVSWPSSWLISFMVALPLCIVVVPFTKRLVAMILDWLKASPAVKKEE